MTPAATGAASHSHYPRGPASPPPPPPSQRPPHRRPSTARPTSTAASISPSSSTSSLLAVQKRNLPPRPLKIVVIGPASVGKTSLRHSYFTGRFQHNYKATIGADFEAKVVEYSSDFSSALHTDRAQDKAKAKAKGKGKEPASIHQKVLLTVWDTAGQERFRALGSAFYRGADAAVVCFDASSESEETVRKAISDWYDDFSTNAGLTERQRRSFCWIAVGCKADLRGQEGARVVPRRRVRRLLNSLVPRQGHREDAGTDSYAVSLEDSRPGDHSPADPMEVLAREGRHEEDDRDLGLDSASDANLSGSSGVHQQSNIADADAHGNLSGLSIGDSPSVPEAEAAAAAERNDAAGARPGQMAGRQNGREPDADCQDDRHSHRSRQSTSEATEETQHPSEHRENNSTPSPGTPIKSHPRKNVDASLQPFPSSGSAGSLPRTPPSRSQLGPAPNGQLNAKEPKIGHASFTHSKRDRLDSTMSLASTSQVSIYHTPRNSTLWDPASANLTHRGASESSNASTTVGLGQSPTRVSHRQGQSHEGRLLPSSSLAGPSRSTSAATIIKHDSGDEEIESNDAMAKTARPSMPGAVESDRTITRHQASVGRRRALSTPSVQSLNYESDTEHEDGVENSERAGEEQDDSRAAISPERHQLSDLLPAAPPKPLDGFSLFYTSSLTGSNVREVFEHIVSRCARQWAWEDYEHNQAGMAQRLLAEKERGQKAKKRRSFWETLGRKGKTAKDISLMNGGQDHDAAAAAEEEERMHEEMRRMVRLSDGKGDDSQRMLGGCC